MKSKYAHNFRFFQEKINGFLNSFPSYFSYLPIRILNNCILLPIEADNQNTALRIFSTLNDRGLPLSDADIFKAQFYKFYSKKNEKDKFISRWRDLEEVCNKNFRPTTGTPMDELFTRYMYYERALQGNKSSTTEALRKFYEKDSYALLNRDETLNNLEILADFWNDVLSQDKTRFSDRVLRRLFVLNYAPNGMWNYFVSVYFMHNKDTNGYLQEESFYYFLTKITSFIWAYALTNPGVNALRTPVFSEMINVVNGSDVDFSEWKFDETTLRSVIANYTFSNNRTITKSMLTQWAFQHDEQQLLDLDTVLETEHIFAKKRQEMHKELSNSKNLEILGNKSLLEKKINIRASDYRFQDKTKYYIGFTNERGQKKDGTKIHELVSLANTKSDFVENDIEQRNSKIINSFVDFLRDNNLIKTL